MVGKPTSRGCKTCRTRRIKCDLLRPVCGCCTKAGWDCPGYTDRFIQVSENVFASQRRSKEYHAVATVPKTLTSSSDRLRIEFVYRLEGNSLAARMTMMPTLHVLKEIPVLIGNNVALDSAVRCIAHGAASSYTKVSVLGWKLYDRALKALREVLVDQILQLAPETLAAATLLQMHEHYLDSTSANWSYHAKGVIKMLQAKGPEKLKTDVERAILEAQAGNAFMSALATRDDGFLANEAWTGTFTTPGTTWTTILRPSTDEDGHLDRFMRMVVDDHRSPGIDNLCSVMLRDCQMKATELQAKNILFARSVDDALRMRAQLGHRLASRPCFQCEDRMGDPIVTAAYAATGFFLIITITLVLSLHDQMRRLFINDNFALPDGLSEDLLRQERADVLGLVTGRFRALKAMDPKISHTAPAALRSILGTVLGLAKPSGHESATLLMMLEEGITIAVATGHT